MTLGHPWGTLVLPLNLCPPLPLFPRASDLFGGILGSGEAHATPELDHMTWAEPIVCLLQ